MDVVSRRWRRRRAREKPFRTTRASKNALGKCNTLFWGVVFRVFTHLFFISLSSVLNPKTIVLLPFFLRATTTYNRSCCDPRGGRKLQKQIGLRGRSWSVTHEGFGRIRGHVDGFGAGRERDGARRDGYRGRRERFEIGDECRATRYGRCG